MNVLSAPSDTLHPEVGSWIKFSPLLVIGLLLAVGLRLFVAAMGQNFDMQSYEIVAKIICAGGNVYSETKRYNYGPVWFYILGALHYLSVKFSTSNTAFHYLIAIFLSLTDIGIFFVLRKKITSKAAFLFLFNPVSIIITGYHSQFDNLAILLGLCSVLVFGDPCGEYTLKQLAVGIILLGLSITTKHLLFLFPLWMAIKFKNKWHSLLVLAIPPIIFIMTFLPYWEIGHNGIVQNVFLYKSHNNAPLINLLAPQLANLISPKVLFFAFLAAGALVFKKQSPLHSLLIYTSMLVIFSSALANQYLAIVIPFIAVFPNLFFIAYTIVSTWFLLINEYGLNLSALQHYTPPFISFDFIIILLFIGFSWFTWKVKSHKNTN